jgi:hypothetical protein
MPESLKESALQDVYGRDKTHLGNLAVHIRAYTDNLAGKKALEDRVIENNIGRTFYNVSKALENRVASNMVAVNPASWMTNFIPLTQGTEVKAASTAKALGTTLQSYLKDDGFSKMSDFLINRKGSDPLWRTKTQAVSQTLSSPMRMIDQFTTEVLTRAKYYDEIAKGVTHDNAMKAADKFTASVVADRSKGGLPVIFNARNPLAKLMTMFQVEVNNQYSYLLKDLPRNMQGQGRAKLTGAIAKYMIGAYIYNNVYEELVGRRPALDPIGMVQNLYEGVTDEDKTKTQAIGAFGKEAVGNLPFVGGLFEGGRIPISSALPNVATLGTAGAGLVTGEVNKDKAYSNIRKELAKPLFYIAPPTGGGQLKKIYETAKTLNDGGSYGMDAEGRPKLQFAVDKTPANAIKGAVFGKYSLPGAQEWVENGFKTMGAKATEGYQKAIKTGMSAEEFTSFHKETRDKKSTQVREMIMNSKFTPEQKKILSDALVNSDKEVDYSSKENYNFSMLSKETQQKYLGMGNVGISKDQFINVMRYADMNGNGAVSQEEAQKILNNTNLSDKQKSALWKTINRGWKHNPYEGQ